MNSVYDILGWAKMGCPIRKSSDHGLFATPRSISLLTTSFIALVCLAIHHRLLVAWPFWILGLQLNFILHNCQRARCTLLNAHTKFIFKSYYLLKITSQIFHVKPKRIKWFDSLRSPLLKWTCGGSNPGPIACKASALPKWATGPTDPPP